MNSNRVITISTVKQFMRWWPFIHEGLEYFQKELDWEKTADDYFKFLLHAHAQGEGYSFISILVSPGGEPYGYIVAVNNTAPFSPKSCNVYAIYSNKKCPSTVAELTAEAQQWAILHGYKEVYACSYRLSGGAMGWFERKMKFKKKYMVFWKKL